MDRNILEKHISEGCSIRQIASKQSVAPVTVRYWLKKYKLKTQYTERDHQGFHCNKCGQSDPSRFYKTQRWLCSACFNAYKTELARVKRDMALDLLGPRCIVCGFEKYKCSLDIHHVDLERKDPNFRHMRGWSSERIVEEIKNCIVLCKCCHTAYHCGLLQRSW
jgi:ribosomal protein L37AE/L43A